MRTSVPGAAEKNKGGVDLSPAGLGAAACHRRPFQRRDLLPAPRKPLRLRPGEQNLHTDSAPPPATGGLFRGAICSPPLANPCGSVPGSKIFTAIPRRRLPPAAFSAARFAPRSSQSLAAPFRGAKSSQRFRAAACFRRPFKLDSYNFFLKLY